VVNPVAGPLGSQRALKDLIDRAEKMGVDLDVVETRIDFNGTDAAASRERDYDCYLALGGDGTVMEVAEAAMARNVPLAILPRGTANAVAWHFGIPFDVGRALKVAIQGRPVRIDVAEAAGRRFLLVAGLGYDAHVIRDATRQLKRRLGFLAYLVAALKNLGRRPYLFQVSLDGGEPFRARGAMAVVANIGTLAGNIRVVRAVSPDDGLLDLLIVSPANFGDFFRMVVWGTLGRLEADPRVRYYQAAEIRLECRPLAPLEVDGNGIEGRHREVVVRVHPRSLTLLVPPEGMLRLPWIPEVPWSPSLPRGRGRGGGRSEGI
jgi:YegS/Rv2252/BmrU family lipid kinase